MILIRKKLRLTRIFLVIPQQNYSLFHCKRKTTSLNINSLISNIRICLFCPLFTFDIEHYLYLLMLNIIDRASIERKKNIIMQSTA